MRKLHNTKMCSLFNGFFCFSISSLKFFVITNFVICLRGISLGQKYIIKKKKARKGIKVQICIIFIFNKI